MYKSLFILQNVFVILLQLLHAVTSYDLSFDETTARGHSLKPLK